MASLLHELSRAARLTPLEVRTRWHAARTQRLERLTSKHRAALNDCVGQVRDFADAR